MSAYPSTFTLDELTPFYGVRVLNDLLNNNTPGVRGQLTGRSVAMVGDVNGDGIGDFLIGAPWGESDGDPATSNRGAAFLVFGTASGLPASFELSALDGTNGVRLIGAVPNGASGWDVVGMGDLNGDGFADFAISTPGEDPLGPPANDNVTIVYGKASWAAQEGISGFTIQATGSRLNPGLENLGDVNGDGLDDVAVTRGDGTIFVVFGQADLAAAFGGPLNLDTPGVIDGTNGFRVTGRGLRAAGDVNGDGFADMQLFLASAGENNYEGASFIVYGHAGAFDDVASGYPGIPILPDPADYSALLSTHGSGTPAAAGRWFGSTGTGVGDLNGDGFADVAADDSVGGMLHVYFGSGGGFGAGIAASGLNGTNGFTVTNLPTGGSTNPSQVIAAAAGDLNDDGVADLAIGVPVANGLRGHVYIIYGTTGGFSATIDVAAMTPEQGFRIDGVLFPSSSTFPQWGQELAGGQDINGDGIDDLLIGAPDNNSGAGSVAVLYGRATPTATIILRGLPTGDGLWGGGFADTLIGNGGNDVLRGLAGNDVLDGGAGDDALHGDDGDDVLLGGSGNDAMRGGSGDDTYWVDALGDTVVELASEGFDTVRSAIAYYLGANVENLRLAGAATHGEGNALNNVIWGGREAATLYGHEGHDTIYGSTKGDIILGGVGEDQLYGNAGVDTIYGEGDNDTINGGGNGDTLYGDGGDDLVRGDAGNDSLFGGSGDDRLEGGLNNDTLRGDAGIDRLFGNDGVDVLIGGGDRDILTGGLGADDFVFDEPDFAGLTANTADRIVDFVVAEGDDIDLSLVDANAVSGDGINNAFTYIGNAAFSNVAGQLRWEHTGGNTMVFMDVNGDSVADYAIRLDGTINLAEASFIL